MCDLRFARATSCSLRTPAEPATIGRCSATSHGAVSTRSSIRTPSFPYDQPLLASMSRADNPTRNRTGGRQMIRCVRLWTGDDKNSYFEEGTIELSPGQRSDWLSDKLAVATISFQETASGGAFAWHTAPV